MYVLWNIWFYKKCDLVSYLPAYRQSDSYRSSAPKNTVVRDIWLSPQKSQILQIKYDLCFFAKKKNVKTILFIFEK